MYELIDYIKEKYSEDFGLSLNFFEIIVFIIYLIASYQFLCGGNAGIWNALITKSASSIFVGDNSLFSNIRVADYLLSALLTFLTKFGYQYLRTIFYDYFSSFKKIDSYVDKLKEQYVSNKLSSYAMRIYVANVAKEQKELYMKRITAINGVGLVLMSCVITSLFGMLTFNYVDFLMMIAGLALFFFVQWHIFAQYLSQVVPRLVLERTARGESVQFGDELP